MNEQPVIKVGIMSAEVVEFTLTGKFYNGIVGKEFEGICQASVRNDFLVVTTEIGELSVVLPVLFEPVSDIHSFFELKNVTIGINFHWEQKENQRFQGKLLLLARNKKVEVINVLPLEKYLISVISSEMKGDSSLHLLKAHAVISRSWLLAQVVKKDEVKTEKQQYSATRISETEYIKWYDREDHDLFDVCADDHCQRYQGITRAHNANVVKAVTETEGQVLMYDNKICDARFSKSCGGMSEHFENCWEPVHHPYLTQVYDNAAPLNDFNPDLTVEANAEKWILSNPEAFCNTTDKDILGQVLNNYDLISKNFYRWEISYTQKELSELIKNRSGIDFGHITDLIPVQRGASGRLVKLKIVGTLKTLIVGKELEIRRWLSPSHLYSSAFIVEKQGADNQLPEKILLKGAGWGHGAGLCQIGAAVMGHNGYTYKQILQHYFKNSEIEKIY